jgi:hypothetical protein
MGSLIQTKGTQRLVKLFNSRFSNLANARKWNYSSGGNITNISTAFNAGKLVDISDKFIAQNADVSSAQTWPADLNDLFYPSATLNVSGITNVTTFTFNIPSSGNPPQAILASSGGAPGSAVSCINKKKGIPHKTTVNSFTVSGTTLTVIFTKNCPNLALGDQVCFALGNHERLVRRWRWYLQYDLTGPNNDTIRQAIDAALDDDTYLNIQFQTVEDKQQVVVTPTAMLTTDGTDELTDNMQMNILLMTQSTTAPDKLDPQ